MIISGICHHKRRWKMYFNRKYNIIKSYNINCPVQCSRLKRLKKKKK